VILLAALAQVCAKQGDMPAAREALHKAKTLAFTFDAAPDYTATNIRFYKKDALPAYSSDDCVTWSKPEIFDDLGVFPALLTLNNGVTLATYGRPGLYLRATADPAGRKWDDRVELVAPTPVFQQDTCAYTGMIAVDDNTAYLVYSDFQRPNAKGTPVKTIMGRTIRAEIV